tara:strand:- start:898 stop:1068 length:171 start_codon:yes stop_codon:yes gene_type:complete
MEEKFSSIEILNAVEEILSKKKNKIEKKQINQKKIKSVVPVDTENIILQAERFLKK